jgi:hypothetical protein
MISTQTLTIRNELGEEEVWLVDRATAVLFEEGKGSEDCALMLEVWTSAEPVKSCPYFGAIGSPKASFYCQYPRHQLQNIVGKQLESPVGMPDDGSGETTFHYCEHGPLDENIIEILAGDGTRLHLKWRATTENVVTSDPDAPRHEVLVDALFQATVRTSFGELIEELPGGGTSYSKKLNDAPGYAL